MIKKVLGFLLGICLIFNTFCQTNIFAINYPLSDGSLDKTNVYLDGYSDIGMDVKFAQWSYSEWAKPTDDDVICFHFNQTEYVAPFVDVIFHSQILAKQYVYQADIYPVVNETSSFNLGEMTDSSKKYSYLATLDKDGFICVNGAQVKKIPYNEWTTVAVAVDTETGLGDLYINNILEKADLPLHNGGTYLPTYVRIGFSRTGVRGHNEAYVNAVKLYSGNKIKVFDDTLKKEAVIDGDYYYIGENEQLAKDILNNDSMFISNSESYFAKGQKQYYSNNKYPYTTDDDVLMIPAEYISDTLDVNIVCTGKSIFTNGIIFSVGNSESGAIKLDTAPVIKNNTYYLPVYSFAKNVLGKYAYSDKRGFVIVSDTNKNYSNSDDPAVNEEFSDIVYRYMQFSRPCGDKLYEDVVGNAGSIYPRMFINSEEIAELKKSVEENQWLNSEKRRLLNSCEVHMSRDVEPFEFDYSEGQRLFTPFLVIRQRIFDLSMGYYFTDNEKYLERMWLECENVLSWPHWNFPENGGSFLDSGNIGSAMALAWDTLYNWMDNEKKDFFIKQIDEKYLSYMTSVFEGKVRISPDDARLKHTNWGAVTMSSAFLVSMSFMDDNIADDEFLEKCKFIASSSLKMLEYPIGCMYPDGAIIEGLAYWTYYVEGLSWSINAMVNMCDTDYGFLSSKGYRDAIEYGLNIQTSNGSYNYATTTTESVIGVPELFAIAKLYDDSSAMESIRDFYINTNMHLGSRGLMFYRQGTKDEELPIQKDNLFEGLQIATMRSSYDDNNAAYVGILGGINSTSSHFDKGSFIFDLGGVRWICDLGGEIKDVYGGYYHAEGWNLYRKRTEGHNSIVINPYNNEKVTELIASNKDMAQFNSNDSYTGQSIGGKAEFSEFTSKDFGSVAVMDLSDVYQKSTQSYKRGYYLGDNRRSLVIRDELELTSDNSSLYWNLHTKGGVITVDGNVAYIDKQGKRLKIEIITNIPEYTLSVEEAQPLDESMIRGVGVEGAIMEYSRDNYSKLLLSGNASGSVYISAKLSLVSDPDIASLDDTPISDWYIPDGELSGIVPVPGENFKFTSSNVYVSSPDGKIEVSATMPYKPDSLSIFLNDKEVYCKDNYFNKDGNEKFLIDVSGLDVANARLRMEYNYSGVTVSVCDDILIYAPTDENELINTSFETLVADDDSAAVVNKLNKDMSLHIVNGYTVSASAEGGMEIAIASSGEANAGYISKSIADSCENDVIHARWTISTYNNINMSFSARDMSGKNSSPSVVKSIPVEYGTNTYELFLDGDKYMYCIYSENGNRIYESSGSFISNSGGWSEFKIKFYAVISESGMILKDLSLSTYSCEKPFSNISATDGGYSLELSKNENSVFYQVKYDDQQSIISDICIIDENSINTDDRIYKIYAWDKQSLKPLCNPVYLYN